MPSTVRHAPSVPSPPPPGYVLGFPIDELRSRFAADGFLTFQGVVSAEPLAELAKTLREEFDRTKKSGRLFTGGGTYNGHLNCFPGASSRFVLGTLDERGVLGLVRALSPTPLREPNVGCNFNLAGSNEQNEHVDGNAGQPFFVVNVAVVETNLENGAMEVLPRTHLARHKYWKLMLARPERLRLRMDPGDVMIRLSSLWHRGMPNRTASARPMLAFSWEDGGSPEPDPYAIHGGRITFLPNRYATDRKGRLRERAFAASPTLGRAFRVVQSIFERG